MTRNDIKALFPDATKEAIDQLLDINSSDIGKAMTKSQTAQDQLDARIKAQDEQITSLTDRVKALTADVTQRDETIRTLTDKHSGELTTLNEQLKAAQEKATVADSLTEQVTKLTQDVADRDATIAKTTKQYLVRDALRGMHARNVDVLLPLLNLDNITVKEDNTLEGFDEQMKPIQERDAYLFETNTGAQRAGAGASPDVGDGATPSSVVNQAIRQAAGRR